MIYKKDRILRKLDIIYKTGLSDTTIRRREKEGCFPKRIWLGGNAVGWLESEIDEWINDKAAER